MDNLQKRLDDLRRKLQNLPDDPQAVARLENTARTLLADAKNTPHEPAAQALFAELARLSNPTSPTAATVRGLVRRARIRIEIAGDDDDIDEAIDILAEALSLAPQDKDVIALLRQAAERSPQAAQRVNDLFARYGVARIEPPAPPPPPDSGAKSPVQPISYPTSSGYPAPEQEIYPEASTTARRMPGRGPLYTAPDVDEMLSELTQAYYSGEYQQAVDLANRVLTLQPGNPTALDYRQKSEDNLIRGVVPDHRIPFDARVAYNRANSLVRAGNYEEAERLYREARDLAERSGILSWKDAEQALLDIQDLALARELLVEGDRLMKTDNWSEALRKYEGALRVVPNDPQAQERIDMVRRVQADADQVSVQLSMLSGTLSEQVAQLQNILNILMRVRQVLPDSQRLAQLAQTANNKLTGIKTQLYDQAQAALNRANNASRLEERLTMTNEALNLLELGVKLDPGDTALAESLLETRTASSDMQRARQVIERASALIAQNFDNELSQARSMLAGLRDYAQDERYRAVVSDLMGRYIERAEFAIEEGNAAEAESWLEALRDEPFRLLGRRSEVLRVENEVRAMRRQGRLRLALIALAVILMGTAGAVATQAAWMPVLFPPPTSTPTATFTPSITPLPSDTPLPTSTPSPTDTPTNTPTLTPTYTPSYTVTPSLTPTDTPSPTHTPTITPTLTPSDTPTLTLTPTITPTLTVLCVVINFSDNPARIRSNPTTGPGSVIAGFLYKGVAANVIAQQRGTVDNALWYQVQVQLEGASVTGWMRYDTVQQISPCPPLD
ncbi:MAG: hypothetical protein HZC41_03300 [Chloroflexi bacterium]|nr:hypothetical protein [Chloroflexota bacterium]